MKKILILLLPLISLILLFSGCSAPMEPQSAEPTGGAIAVNETHYNYPVELANKVSSLGTGKFVLIESELAFLKTGEKFSVEINKKGLIDQYGFSYEYTLPETLSIGESTEGYWLHKKAAITYSSSSIVSVESEGKTIELKNFNAVKSITAGKFNTEFILNNEKLAGIKIYSTGINLNAEDIKSIYG